MIRVEGDRIIINVDHLRDACLEETIEPFNGFLAMVCLDVEISLSSNKTIRLNNGIDIGVVAHLSPEI